MMFIVICNPDTASTYAYMSRVPSSSWAWLSEEKLFMFGLLPPKWDAKNLLSKHDHKCRARETNVRTTQWQNYVHRQHKQKIAMKNLL